MGKKLFWTFLFVMLFAALLAASAFAETAVVTGKDVNMREGPGTGFRIIDCLPEGESVTVTDRSNPSWYAVEHDGVVGFMSAAFLEISEEEESTQTVVNAIRGKLGDGLEGYVDAMYVRMRSAPGSDYSVLGEYNRGKALRYYGTFGDWAACIIDGKPGYIFAEYVALGRYGEGTQTQGWDTAGEELPTNLRIEQEAEGEADYGEPTSSDLLALQHAMDPEAEQIPAYINANYVRFRKGPGSNYPILETYSAGTVIGVTGIYMDWAACYIDGTFGFVYANYVTIPQTPAPEEEMEPWEETTETVETAVQVPIPTPARQFAGTEGYVAGNNVRMRYAPSMSAPIVDELSYGNTLTIVGATDDWAAVICNGKAGYIYGQFVKVGSFVPMEAAGEGYGYSALSGDSLERGKQIAMYAVQFVGYNYCWGGKDPSTGFDCSGLVYYVYQHFGIELNRVAQEQAKNGVPVSVEELQPGDILCFYSGSSYIGHSGIYIGFGMFVHAQNSATGVVITELSGHYADRGFLARRVV